MDTDRASPHSPATPSLVLESTSSLLARMRAGDMEARDSIVARYLPAIKRWAHGRLPSRSRDLLDTDDLVQVTFMRALEKMEGFEPHRTGAFLAYLRRILVNKIRDEARRACRSPGREQLTEDVQASVRTPLEIALGREKVEAYEKALVSLPEDHQAAIVMRVELGFTYREIAESLGKSSEQAAHMFVTRALVKLSEVLDVRP